MLILDVMSKRSFGRILDEAGWPRSVPGMGGKTRFRHGIKLTNYVIT